MGVTSHLADPQTIAEVFETQVMALGASPSLPPLPLPAFCCSSPPVN